MISIDEDKQQLKSAYTEKKKQTTKTKVIQEINKSHAYSHYGLLLPTAYDKYG